MTVWAREAGIMSQAVQIASQKRAATSLAFRGFVFIFVLVSVIVFYRWLCRF
jgi:F0F1-type ATP synthase membrane subunit c/vacuolar-type H+-ATPase subunit K